MRFKCDWSSDVYSSDLLWLLGGDEPVNVNLAVAAEEPKRHVHSRWRNRRRMRSVSGRLRPDRLLRLRSLEHVQQCPAHLRLVERLAARLQPRQREQELPSL